MLEKEEGGSSPALQVRRAGYTVIVTASYLKKSLFKLDMGCEKHNTQGNGFPTTFLSKALVQRTIPAKYNGLVVLY